MIIKMPTNFVGVVNLVRATKKREFEFCLLDWPKPSRSNYIFLLRTVSRKTESHTRPGHKASIDDETLVFLSSDTDYFVLLFILYS